MQVEAAIQYMSTCMDLLLYPNVASEAPEVYGMDDSLGRTTDSVFWPKKRTHPATRSAFSAVLL